MRRVVCSSVRRVVAVIVVVVVIIIITVVIIILVNTNKGYNMAGEHIDYANKARGVVPIIAKNRVVIPALYKISTSRGPSASVR